MLSVGDSINTVLKSNYTIKLRYENLKTIKADISYTSIIKQDSYLLLFEFIEKNNYFFFS